MENTYKTLIEKIGEDPAREGLRATPARAAKAMGFLTSGYRETAEEVLGDALFSSQSDEMVVVKNIELYSLCEHHILPFFGTCHIGYIPNGKVMGLSKMARVVEVFARRLQIQEHLTMQIAESVQELSMARGVGVVVQAKHLCMMMRGVQKQNSNATTSAMLGWFRKSRATRAEFLELIKG